MSAVVGAAVDHPVSHRGQRLATGALLDPRHQRRHRCGVVRCRQRPRDVLCPIHPSHRESGVGPPDPLDPTPQNAMRRFAGVEQRELDTRRAAIDRQDAADVRFHSDGKPAVPRDPTTSRAGVAPLEQRRHRSGRVYGDRGVQAGVPVEDHDPTAGGVLVMR